jgi:hypothetical protein
MRAVASPMPLVAPVITITCWAMGFRRTVITAPGLL